jgi:hypothetical protein
LTLAFGVTTVPESIVPVGAIIAVTPTSITVGRFTVTEPDRVSLLWTWSPERAVEQRLVKVPSCVGVQLAKNTVTESPAARLETFWESE